MVCFVRILSHSWEACPIMAPVLDARASWLAMKPLLTNLAQRGSGGVTPFRIRADNLEQAQVPEKVASSSEITDAYTRPGP